MSQREIKINVRNDLLNAMSSVPSKSKKTDHMTTSAHGENDSNSKFNKHKEKRKINLETPANKENIAKGNRRGDRYLPRRKTIKEAEDEVKNLTEWMWANQDSGIISAGDKSSRKCEQFTGLVNKRNDCWLNCLLQCFHALPLRDTLLERIKNENEWNVTATSAKVMSDMECSKNASIYPTEFQHSCK